MTTTARGSLILSFAQRYAILAIRLVALVVLSRLLTPVELGYYVAASAIVSLGQVLADCGTAQFIVQSRALTRSTEQTALGAGLVTSCVAAAAVLTVSFLAPSALMPAEIRTSAQILVVTLLLYPFSNLASAVLQREMRFGELAWISIAAALGSVATSIALAMAGASFMSLVWGTVIEAAITTTLLLRSHRLVFPSLADWRAFLDFGWIWSSINGLRQISDASVRLSVGALLGLGAVGLMSRAQNVMLLFDKLLLDALGPVLLPTLAGRLRDGREVKAVHMRMIACVSATAWAFFSVLALCADPFVRLMLGPQWLDAIAPIRILCIGGLFMPFSGLALQYFLALGTLRSYLPYHAVVQAAKAVLVAAASTISLELACLALVTEPALKGIFAQRLLEQHLGSARKDGRHGLCGSAAASIAAFAAAALAYSAIDSAAPPLLVLVACAGAALPAWLAALLLTKHPLIDELRHALSLAQANLRRAAHAHDSHGRGASREHATLRETSRGAQSRIGEDP
ncbi:MAG: oligosaccharide flippase family protein [Hyphomicrobium sp.]